MLLLVGRSNTMPVMAQGRQWPRLFWSAFLHADEMHLFYNMSSLLWKVAASFLPLEPT